MANRAFARVTRRKTQWAGFGDSAGAANLPTALNLTPGTAQILSVGAIISGAVGFLDEEVMLTRTIGMVSVAMDADTAEAQGAFVVGGGVFRSEAVAAGVGFLPSPESDPDFEWIYMVSGILINLTGTSREGPISGMHIPFDICSQRVVRSGQTFAWIAEAQSTGVTLGVNGRYLAKLA